MASPIDRFNELPLKQRLGIVGGVGIALAGVLGYMAYSALGELGPDREVSWLATLAPEGGIWAQIATTENQIQTEKAVADQLDEVEAQLKALADTIAEQERRLPREKEKAEVRERLQQFANEIEGEYGEVDILGVQIREVDPNRGRGRRGAQNQESNYESISYICDITADMNGIISFIDKVEKERRFMKIENISISPGGVSYDKDLNEIIYEPHSAKIEVETYIFATEEEER